MLARTNIILFNYIHVYQEQLNSCKCYIILELIIFWFKKYYLFIKEEKKV